MWIITRWLHHKVAPSFCCSFSLTMSVTTGFCPVLELGMAGKIWGWGWWAYLHIRSCQIMSCKYISVTIFQYFAWADMCPQMKGVFMKVLQGFFTQNAQFLCRSLMEKISESCEICWPGASVRCLISILHPVQIHNLPHMFDSCDIYHSCKSYKYSPTTIWIFGQGH